MQDMQQINQKLKSVLFQICCDKIQQIMKKESKIDIEIFDEYQLDSPQNVIICPDMQIDVNQLLHACLKKDHNIRDIGIVNDSEQIIFYLDLSILERFSQKYNMLKTINLQKCNIGDKGIKVLKRMSLSFLQRLELVSNELTKSGMKVLATCKFKSLRVLDLSTNKIGNAGLSYLSKSSWPKISCIDITECNYTMDGMRIIRKAYWPNIKSFFYKGTMAEFLYVRPMKEFAKEFSAIACLSDSPRVYETWGMTNGIFRNQSPDFEYVRLISKKSG